jgi:hypothetical protein
MGTAQLSLPSHSREVRLWRFVYEKAAGRGTHCMEPVAWPGKWKFLKGWTDVWSCERHADDLPRARRLQSCG